MTNRGSSLLTVLLVLLGEERQVFGDAIVAALCFLALPDALASATSDEAARRLLFLLLAGGKLSPAVSAAISNASTIIGLLELLGRPAPPPAPAPPAPPPAPLPPPADAPPADTVPPTAAPPASLPPSVPPAPRPSPGRP